MAVMTQDKTDRSISREFDLVPLNPALATHLPGLDEALGSGPLIPDRTHKDFFEVRRGRRWFYVYVRESTSTIYLVAHRSFRTDSSKSRKSY